jgi:hypothetical protein
VSSEYLSTVRLDFNLRYGFHTEAQAETADAREQV